MIEVSDIEELNELIRRTARPNRRHWGDAYELHHSDKLSKNGFTILDPDEGKFIDTKDQQRAVEIEYEVNGFTEDGEPIIETFDPPTRRDYPIDIVAEKGGIRYYFEIKHGGIAGGYEDLPPALKGATERLLNQAIKAQAILDALDASETAVFVIRVEKDIDKVTRDALELLAPDVKFETNWGEGFGSP